MFTLTIAVALALLGDSGGPPPLSQTQSGITCTLMACEGSVRTAFAEKSGKATTERLFQVQAQVTAPRDGPPMRVMGMEIIELVDDRERDLLATDKPTKVVRYRPGRREMVEQLASSMRNESETRQHVSDQVRGLPSVPATIATVRARVETVVVGKVVRETIALAAQEEAVELCPGLTFLLARAERQGNQFKLGFEVRTRRNREGDARPPGTEPVFAGLVFKDAAGNIMTSLNHGQEIETRDEYIMVMKDMTMDPDYIARIARVEVLAFDDIKPVVFEIGATNVPLNQD